MPTRRTLAVEGMACGGCEQTITSALEKVPGVRRVEADHEAGTVEVVADDDTDEDTLRQAVHDAGYEVPA